MKKSYYCEIDNHNLSAGSQNGYSNTDNEKRKFLSIETNRRRRDMAVRVKRQIEKEEERRNEILRERREYHENMSNKMRKTRRSKISKFQNSNPPQPWDLDQTLNLIRHNSSTPNLNNTHDGNYSNLTYKTVLEGAWSDFREGCPSPMAKYSGANSNIKHRTNDFYLKTFETKLIAQEQSFKQKQNSDMTEFDRILDETIVGLEPVNNNISQNNTEQNSTFRVDSYPNNIKDNLVVSSNTNIEEILEDSLNESDDENFDVPDHNKKEVPKETSHIEIPVKKREEICKNENNKINPIKSILKKDNESKFNSNPDLSGIMLRDSMEVTRIKSARVNRSNSFSQGLNYLPNKTEDKGCNGEDDNGRKIVRFADEPQISKKEGIIIITSGSENLNQSQRHLVNSKMQRISSVPNSTPLKPPLHPRSAQEGSYLQATFKKPTIFHPPPKPRKISAEILDNEFGNIVNQKRPMKSPHNLINGSDTCQQGDSTIALDKTPTEREIDLLWAEVRECLSRTQKPSKTGSVGTPAGISVRTVDSGSESSVWSAPAWQRNIKKTPQFQIRHHGSITPKQNIYQGQEPPIKDLVIVHTSHEDFVSSGVIQQPLSVLTRQNQGFQEVSESLEEFLSTENACNVSQSPRNVFLPHPPATLNRPRFRPPIKYKLLTPSHSPNVPNSVLPTSNVQKTQLSLDEENIKMSLDRLNERLKNVTNLL